MKSSEESAAEIAARWIDRFGLGFHPDTRGANYVPALSAEDIARYDADMELLFEHAADPYDLSIRAWKEKGLL
jgi:hypothetical protein